MRLFVTDTSGANPTLLQETLMPLITSSNTVIGATVTMTFANGLVINSGQLLKVAQSLCATSADNSAVVTQGGNY